jgi:LPXTG-motif cell wall-anchored protein
MDHDELFTVEFDATVVSDNDSTSKDLIITAQYKNGYNQHEAVIDDLILTIVPDKPKSGNEMTIFGILAAIVVVSSLIIYRRKKQQQ